MYPLYYGFSSLYSIVYLLVFVWLIVKVVGLSREVKRLREKVDSTSSYKGNYTPSPSFNTQNISEKYSQVVPASFSTQTNSISAENKFINWFKENWLSKIGVLMILVGFGWFISYAFVHDWIGPVGRVALGFIVGSIITLIGTLRLGKDDISGTMLLVLGSAIVVITSYASEVVYDFFPTMVALAIPFIVSLYLTTVAVAYNKSKIAIYAVVIGLFAPILTHEYNFDINLLYMYLALVALGSVWVASVKNWRQINAVSLLGTLLYTAPHILDFYYSSVRDNNFVLSIIFSLAIVYFVVSVIGIIKSKQDASQADAVVAIFNAILIVGVTNAFVPKEIQSLILAMWMLLFAFGSFFVFSKTGREKFFYVYSLIAVMFLAVATSAELQGYTLVIAYAFESAIISVASYLITNSRRVGYKMSVFMAVPAFMALSSFNSYGWQNVVLNPDFFVIFTVGVLFMLTGISYYILRNEQSTDTDKNLPKAYVAHMVVGSFYLLGLIWLSLQSALNDESLAIIIAMVIYTIIGLSCYFKGVFTPNKAFKYYGSVLLILVVARLLLVDVWRMPLAPRIITFVVIGILFISTAFIKNKNSEVKG